MRILKWFSVGVLTFALMPVWFPLLTLGVLLWCVIGAGAAVRGDERDLYRGHW